MILIECIKDIKIQIFPDTEAPSLFQLKKGMQFYVYLDSVKDTGNDTTETTYRYPHPGLGNLIFPGKYFNIIDTDIAILVGDPGPLVLEGGARYNKGKTKLSLVSPVLATKVADVLEFGSQKYAAWNWTQGLSYAELLESAERHLLDLKHGKDIDVPDGWEAGDVIPEGYSGLSLAAHVACNMMFLIHFQTMQTYDRFDDRFKFDLPAPQGD